MRKVMGSNPGEDLYRTSFFFCGVEGLNGRIEWKDQMICGLQFFEEQEEVWTNLLQEELPSTIIIIVEY